MDKTADETIKPGYSMSNETFMLIIISFVGLTDLAVFLDIPWLREILGFLFLSILPGLVVLRILNLKRIDLTQKTALSVGLSISFIMFFGLLLDYLSFRFGNKTPLETSSLLLYLNFMVLFLAVCAYKTNKDQPIDIPRINLCPSGSIFLLIPALFPALSFIGIYLLNSANNNIILVLLLLSISVYVVSVILMNRFFPKRFYPPVIFLISISLVLLLALRSDHLVGIDTHSEYYYFQLTLSSLHQTVSRYSTLDACLSISLLPTVYQSILGLNPEFLFKILYSLLYSVSPLIIYSIARRYVHDSYAFLASCFFMFQSNFLWTALHSRTCIAILFFALWIMTLLEDRMNQAKKRILTIIFIASCIVSHYSTTYIFFFILLITFLGFELASKRHVAERMISSTVVILFFVLVFFWYSQVTEAAFSAGVGFVEKTIVNLNNFFLEEMRSESTQSMLGKGIMQKGVPHKIEFVFTWLMLAYMGFGAIALLGGHDRMQDMGQDKDKSIFLRREPEIAYRIISIVCFGLLIAIVILPYVSAGYDINRVYTVAVTVLSLFFIIGGVTIAGYLKINPYSAILLVLIPYFLCVSGVMYQVYNVPQKIFLHSAGQHYDLWYIHDQESYNAKWLSANLKDNLVIHSDYMGHLRLISQGLIPHASIDFRSFIKEKEVRGYVYLRYDNVKNKRMMAPNSGYKKIDGLHIAEKNRIYDNGGSQTYL